jgi:hypothetical protein
MFEANPASLWAGFITPGTTAFVTGFVTTGLVPPERKSLKKPAQVPTIATTIIVKSRFKYLGSGSRITRKRARKVMSADTTKTATHVQAMTSLMVSGITNLRMALPGDLICLV